MRLRRLATVLAAAAVLCATAVPVAAGSNPTVDTYHTVTLGGFPPNTVVTINYKAATAGQQVVTVLTNAKGQAVFQVLDSLPSKIASALEADARSGSDVHAWVTDTPANRALVRQMRAAGVHVTMVTTHSDALLSVTGKVAYLYTGVGGVAVTNKKAYATLKQLILKTGKNRTFGHKNANGVITSPGPERALERVMGASINNGHGPGSLIVKTGDLHSIMMADALANLAKAGVSIKLIVPTGTGLGSLGTTLENRGNQVIFTKNKFTGTAIVSDGTYGLIYSGNLDYHGLTYSEQIGLTFHGTSVQDLQASLKSHP